MYGFAKWAGRLERAVCAVAAIALAPAAAWSGAWTEPQGQGLMIATLWGWTGVGSPWGGNPAVKQNRGDSQLFVEYGLTDQVTVFGQMAIERYDLTPPNSSYYFGPDYWEVGLRAKLWTSGQWVFSGEATLFLPGAEDPKSPAQAGNTGGATEARALVGRNFDLWSIPGFLDLELAYRIRTAGPPDEWHGDLTVGLKPWPGVILMLQDLATVSMPSTNPSFPAWRQNVVEASVVLPLRDRWQIQIGYFQTVYVYKTNTERGVAIALWRSF